SVWAEREVGQGVRTCFIGEGGAGYSRLRLCCGNFHPWQHRAALILYRTADLSGGLPPYKAAAKAQNEKYIPETNKNRFHPFLHPFTRFVLGPLEKVMPFYSKVNSAL